MTIAKIDLRDTNTTTYPGWTGLLTADTADIPVLDIGGNATGWTIRYESGFVPGGGGAGFDGPGVGDADFVDVAGVMLAAVFHNKFNANALVKIILKGPQEITSLKCASSYGSSGIATDVTWNVNDGTPQTIQSYDSANARAANDAAAVFANIPQNVNGEFEITFTSASSDRGYANAIYIETPDESTLTITNEAAITPGTTLTATASNFTAAPTTISLSDGASPALTPTLTATASGDDYDLSALIADFKAQADSAGEGVAVQGLRIGTITATVE